MKKNVTALIALVLTVTMLLAACGSKQPDPAIADYEQKIAALTEENTLLKQEIEALNKQLMNIQSSVLADWTLTAVATADRSAATVNFTAVPAAQAEGMTVSLIVTLNGFEAESVLCAPDGDRYLATLELPAVDGYSYYCMISTADGSQQQIPLMTPESNGDDALINLGTSLNAYCNLFVESWKHADNTLTVESGFIQAQMPMISTGGEDDTIAEVALVLLHNGEELERKALTLEAGEAEGSYESSVTDISFTTPKLADDHQLDLVLEVKLTSGDIISSSGCSWYAINGQLNPVMG